MKLHLPSIAALGLVAACGGGETLPPHNHVAAVLSEDGEVRLADWAELSASSEEPVDDPAEGDSRIVRAGRHVGVIEVQTPSPLRTRGYSVQGSHTPYDAALGATATYEGVAATLEFYDPVDAVDRWDRTAMSAEGGRLVADFDAGTVSGRFDEWRNVSADPGEGGERPALDVSVTLEPAPITRTGFRGGISVSGTATEAAGTWDVSYEGSFYGPDGDDVAGVMRGTRRAGTGGADQVIGWFTTAEPFDVDLSGE